MKCGCNIQQCKYNGGKFCQKDFVFLYGGVCNELVDKNGNQKNPEFWTRTEPINFNQSDENVR